MLALSIVMISASIVDAAAETEWQRNHPRRDQVNDRLANQNRRVNQAVGEGEITRGRASQLHREDHAIRQEERTVARQNGGHITPAAQTALNQQENGQIGR
jgi:hypothetical protein